MITHSVPTQPQHTQRTNTATAHTTYHHSHSTHNVPTQQDNTQRKPIQSSTSGKYEVTLTHRGGHQCTCMNKPHSRAHTRTDTHKPPPHTHTQAPPPPTHIYTYTDHTHTETTQKRTEPIRRISKTKFAFAFAFQGKSNSVTEFVLFEGLTNRTRTCMTLTRRTLRTDSTAW